MKDKYYIATAIAYTSGKPHIGNVYEIVLADCIARYKRLQGYEVYFQTGTDEHGQKIEEKAASANVTPQEYVDKVAAQIQQLWDGMNAGYDAFVRTTEEKHEKQVQKIFKKLYEQGDIYKDKYEGLYCTPCESFWTSSQLVDGKCPDCGREVSKAYEEAYFFKMSRYADRLMRYYEEHPDFIAPVSRKNEMLNNFLKPGLNDLCVSRTSFKWGIPVDFDDKHVVYVWLDALTNYITKLGYDCEGDSSEEFNKNWPCDLHVVGKDIIRFHTIYWPIFLMALDLPLPKQIYGHPWLLQGDGKMSKSKGNVIYADDLVDLFGLDAVRFFLLRDMPFENDGVMTYELMIERINADLANTLGNLVNRTISMSNKYFDGIVIDTEVVEEVDTSLKEYILSQIPMIEEKMNSFHVAEALNEVINIFKRCNKYIDETEPWVLAKDEMKKGRLATVLYNLIEGINIGATLIIPFMPDTADKIFESINSKPRKYDELNTFGLYVSKTKVTDNPQILFARLDAKDIEAKVKEKNKANEENEKAGVEDKQRLPYLPDIAYDDFAKLDLRVGEVLECERVPKSKKLLQSKVKLGSEIRTILSGIYPDYQPEALVGKKVCVLTNLPPKKMAGVESNGMLLCAEDSTGKLSLLTVDKDVESDSQIG